MGAASELEKKREKKKRNKEENPKKKNDKRSSSASMGAAVEKSKKKRKRPNHEPPPMEEENKKNKKDKKHKRDKKKKPRLDPPPMEEENTKNMKDKRSKKRDNGGIITDERFASVHSDPRFQRVPRRESKVPVDERFARMFTDESFAASSAPVDKRGRPRKRNAANPLLHYYLHEKEPKAEEELEEEEGERRSGSEPEAEEEEEELGKFGSETNESSSTDEEEDIDDDDEYSVDSDIVHYLMANHVDTLTIEHETHRLAVVNMDWNHIKAVDLYVVMSSCLPKGGQVLSVAIYPSEFGLKCMETEAVHGPSGLFNDSEEFSEDESEIDNDKLRSYELNKLRYYYAVVVCDSSATANHLYKTLDGTELLRTSNVFDLRFIPDSMEFKHLPRDITTEAPTSYKEPDFQTRALQHSNVKLSWEEDEPQRMKILRRKFNVDQLDELKEYLASTDDESDDDENDEENDLPKGEDRKRIEREKLRALLESGDGSDAENSDDKDMEITFNAGLEDLSKRILGKRDNESETVWEGVLRKRREKKAARKKRSKYSSDEDSSDYDVREAHDPDQPDDFFVDDSLEMDAKVNKKSSKDLSKARHKTSQKGKEQSPEMVKEQEATRAELELLFADDQGADQGPKGYNLKPKKAKGKKRKKEEPDDEDKLPNVDVSEDPRFSALFTSHLFALDPTDPQFKRSAAYARQQSKKQKAGGGAKGTEDQAEQVNDVVPSKDESLHLSGTSIEKEKFELSSTIRSLKRKLGTLKK